MMRRNENSQYFYWCKIICPFLLRLFTPALLQFAMLFGLFLMHIDLQVQQPDDVATGLLVVPQNDQPAVSKLESSKKSDHPRQEVGVRVHPQCASKYPIRQTIASSQHSS